MEPHIAELLQSSRYAKTASVLEELLQDVTNDLRSSDSARRVRGAREISKLARTELSWMKLPVRRYFCSFISRDSIDKALEESDNKTRVALLIAVRNAFERFIVHPMWRDVTDDAEVEAWTAWLCTLAEQFESTSDPALRAEAAYLFAIRHDARAWNLYLEAVSRRSALLPHLELALLRYPQSLGSEARHALLERTNAVVVSHPRHLFVADSIREALKSAPS